MDDELQQRIQALMARVIDVKEQVSSLQEQQPYSTPDADAARRAVEDAGAEYQAILEAAPDADRDAIERRYGRQVIDMKRFAAWLPVKTHGDAVPLAQGDPWTRAMSAPQPSTRSAPAFDQYGMVRTIGARKPTPVGPRVGGDVEAWCGSCKELRMHTIIAMVNDAPKQVLCLSCQARHAFRLFPARAKKAKVAPQKTRTKLSPAEAKRHREEEERANFQRELANASEVRAFDRRTRFKAGQIIDHPDHGRGKIESVVKGSLLVRFRSGRRPISLY